MAITKRAPNTIYLGGGDGPGGESGCTVINDLKAVETIIPGMLLEYHNDGGALAWGVHDSADEPVQVVVALEQIEVNVGVDYAYSDEDLVKAGALRPGAQFWGLVDSGQNIAVSARLQSAGNGTLKAAATGDIRFVAVEGVGAVTTRTRIRVEVL